jgi:hypothetical protein
LEINLSENHKFFFGPIVVQANISKYKKQK